MSVKLNTKYVSPFLKENAYDNIRSEVEAAHDELHNGTGKGNDFLGWLSLPESYDKEEFARIKASAEKIRKDSEVLGLHLGVRHETVRFRFIVAFFSDIFPFFNDKID